MLLNITWRFQYKFVESIENAKCNEIEFLWNAVDTLLTRDFVEALSPDRMRNTPVESNENALGIMWPLIYLLEVFPTFSLYKRLC